MPSTNPPPAARDHKQEVDLALATRGLRRLEVRLVSQVEAQPRRTAAAIRAR